MSDAVGRDLIERIDDPTDPRLADFAGLRHHWRDRPQGYLVVEGPLVVRQLLRSRYPARCVLLTDRGLRAFAGDSETLLHRSGARVYETSQQTIDELCGFNFHRGVLASADLVPLPDIAEVTADAALVVGLEGVNDHENVGGAFRNAAAFGAGAVILDPTTCDPLYRRSLRVSMGHALRVPFARAAHWPAAMTSLRSDGFTLVALTGGGDVDIDELEVPPDGRVLLVAGAEGAGLAASTLAGADHRVRIALEAGVDSLNVATALAVALHALQRRRRVTGRGRSLS